MMNKPTAAGPSETKPAPSVPETAITAATPSSAPEPAPSPKAAPAWSRQVDYLLLALVLVLSFLVSSFAATNSDLWLHLAVGKQISEGTFTFGVDPFSWATEAGPNGQPAAYWVHHSWLYSWLFYHLHQLLGDAGLVVLKAILFTLAIGLVSRIGWNDANRWFIIICLAMAALATSPRLTLSPIVVSLLLLAVTMYVLSRAGVFSLSNAEGPPTCARWLWGLPPLFALWANLDAWFILGPLLVGVCWAATGLARWYKGSTPVPGKTLGLVFAVGLAACLLNPYHVHVFQLPPELAYLAIGLTDPVKIPLPEELVAGGRSLKELRKAEFVADWTVSPVTADYLKGSRGINIARLAFYPLALLGLLSFTLVALTRPQPKAPTLQACRFLVWIVFGVMALTLYRMIPFFALVAAPLTAMTLGEFLRWQQVANETSAGRQDRGLHLARIISIPFLLVLLYLAWPGWLQGTQEFNSNTRVAWLIRPDNSMRRAAETLQALKKSGKGHNAFNVNFDFPNYCAWFAPEVKCFMDSRLALHAGHTVEYVKTRAALLDQRRPEDWQPLFAAHQVDQVVLSNFLFNLSRDPNYLTWITNTAEWRGRYADDRVMVFSLAPPDRPWPEDATLDDWKRAAFGEVPLERRPPLHGTLPPAVPTLWNLYAHGVGTQPTEVLAARLLQRRFLWANDRVMKACEACSALASLLIVPTVQGVPGGGMSIGPLRLVRLFAPTPRPTDFGPPALPILMQRAARRAVAENPLDVTSRLTLIDSNEMVQMQQEDYWIRYQPGRGNHPAPLRERMRVAQKTADLMVLVQLPGLAPNNIFGYQEILAQLALQRNMIDVALEHKQEGLKALLEWRAQGRDLPKDTKKLDALMRQAKEEVDMLEDKVKQRLARWKSMSEGQPPMAQAIRALKGQYVEVVGDKQVHTELGLAKKALEILESIPDDKLKEDERVVRSRIELELQLAIAYPASIVNIADLLRDESRMKSIDPNSIAQHQITVGGIIGDFAMIEQGTATIEKAFQREVAARFRLLAAGVLADTVARFDKNPFAEAPPHTLARMRFVQDPLNELCNVRTLRGIAALESGDTKKAREIFQSIFDEVGRFQFSERPIAIRYWELLNEQK